MMSTVMMSTVMMSTATLSPTSDSMLVIEYPTILFISLSLSHSPSSSSGATDSVEQSTSAGCRTFHQ